MAHRPAVPYTPPAPAPPPAPAAPARPSWTRAEPGEAASIREAVAALRELPWKRSVAVHVGETAAFEQLLVSRGVSPHRRMVGVFVDDAIWLRKTASTLEMTETLAHELVHALERQHGLLRPERVVADEASLAQSALHEGIAIAVARGVAAQQSGSRTPKRTIAELGATLQDLSVSALLSSEHEGSFEDRFPYAVGGGFAGALYATGGAPAWNAAERTPPTQLVQVLRPSLYLTGYSDGAAPLAEPTSLSAAAAAPARRPEPGWLAQAMLGEVDPVQAALWMDDFRGIERLQIGAADSWLIAFGSAHTTDHVMQSLHGRPVTRAGPNHLLQGSARKGRWKTRLPALGAPPLPRWPRAAPVLYPLEADPSLVFQRSKRGARNEALGLVCPGAREVSQKGIASSELRFDSASRGLVTLLVIRLPAAQPVESGLSLLVQAFVDSEVAALQVHDEAPIDTPAGRVFSRRVETPDEAVTVALLPRCGGRYAVTFVAFARELPHQELRTHLAQLGELQPDLQTATCLRAVHDELHDFTPPSPR